MNKKVVIRRNGSDAMTIATVVKETAVRLTVQTKWGFDLTFDKKSGYGIGTDKSARLISQDTAQVEEVEKAETLEEKIYELKKTLNSLFSGQYWKNQQILIKNSVTFEKLVSILPELQELNNQ